MGTGKNKNPLGGFYLQEWNEETEKIGGVKVLTNDSNKRQNDLPVCSGDSRVYFKRNSEGEIIQLRVYDDNRNAMLDIDINPDKAHRNRDGTIIGAGVTHAHDWKLNSNGDLIRSKNARLLTSSEILKYGVLLELSNPNVRYQ